MIDDVILYITFGIFTVLFTGWVVLESQKQQVNIKHHKMKIKEQVDFSMIDRPRPYMFRFLTIPKNTDPESSEEYLSESDSEEHQEHPVPNNNSLNGVLEFVNDIGVVKFAMFNSRPSELIKNFIKNAGIDYRTEVVHLISYESMIES